MKGRNPVAHGSSASSGWLPFAARQIGVRKDTGMILATARRRTETLTGSIIVHGPFADVF